MSRQNLPLTLAAKNELTAAASAEKRFEALRTPAFLLCALAFALVLTSVSAAGAVHSVNSSNYTTAIGNLTGAHTVVFSPGNYTSDLTITQPLSLVSDTGDYRNSSTLFQASLLINSAGASVKGFVFDKDANYLLQIVKPHARIEKNSFVNSQTTYAITGGQTTPRSSNLSIVDNYFANLSSNGVYLQANHNSLIEGNLFTNVVRGIDARSTNTVRILNNKFNTEVQNANIVSRNSIRLLESTDINVTGNVIQNSGLDGSSPASTLSAAIVATTSNANTSITGVIENNTLVGNDDGIAVCNNCRVGDPSYETPKNAIHHVVIRNNNIYSNVGDYDLVHGKTHVALNASYNYWGDSGPNVARFYGNVTYEPAYYDIARNYFSPPENGSCGNLSTSNSPPAAERFSISTNISADADDNMITRYGCASGGVSYDASDDNTTHYNWSCTALYGGQTSSTCSFPKPPVNGTCNTNLPPPSQGCNTGILKDLDDTKLNVRWLCTGTYEGVNSPVCNIQKAGACGTETPNNCTSGSVLSQPHNVTDYLWTCVGRTNDTCSLPRTVNGVCGTHPGETKYCWDHTILNTTAYTDNATHFRWSCDGLNGGNSSGLCSLNMPADGTCGATLNTCTSGSPSSLPNNISHLMWQCHGLYGGENSPVCAVDAPNYGWCGTERDACDQGTWAYLSSNLSHYRWTCEGEGNAGDATCGFARPIVEVNGSCGNGRNLCEMGVNTPLASNATHHKWSCGGENNGTGKSCSSRIPIGGACGPERNTCSSGTSNDGVFEDNLTHYKWRCDGRHGGSNSGICTTDRPVDGKCGSARNACEIGSRVSKNSNDSHYQWLCMGQNGGEYSLCNSEIPTGDLNGSCDLTLLYGCETGSPSSQRFNGTHYDWACLGNGQGTSAYCVVGSPGPEHGICSASPNSCLGGSYNDIYSDTATEFVWRCDGRHGGSNSGVCRANMPRNGECGAQRNTCGLAVEASPESSNSSHYRWSCGGKYGGQAAECSLHLPVDGACSATVNECQNGSLVDVKDTATEHKWLCTGLYGGGNSSVCSASRSVRGVCGITKDSCLAGDSANSGSNSTHYEWTCAGRNGGSDSDVCSAIIPVNGACGSTRNACSDGTPNTVVYGDNSTHYRWRCDGENGGENSACSLNRPINAVCGSTRNRCTAGHINNNDPDTNATHYLWECKGLHEGADSDCKLTRPTNNVNGQCDTTIFGCVYGNVTNRDDSGTYYLTWTCQGENGGQDVSCTKRKPQNGTCGSGRNTCGPGQTASAQPSSDTHYRWTCSGRYGGDATQCESFRPVNGACGDAKNACTAGTLSDVGDTAAEYRWTCEGLYGGRTSDVCSALRPVNGACSTVRNSCSSGSPSVSAPDATNYKWTCEGLYGGTSDSCTSIRLLTTTVNGVCDVSLRNGCIAGTHADGSSNATHYSWSCNGENGGSKASCLLRKPVVNGACGSTPKTCLNGELNGNAYQDNDTQFRWRCDGKNGGSNSGLCSLSKPLTGVCGAERNSCGLNATASVQSPNSTHYAWTCPGRHGGDAAQCGAPLPVTGACGSTINNCERGSLTDVQDTAEEHKWLCSGLYGGSDSAVCSLKRAVNGVCGLTRNACAAGDSGNTGSNATHYTWDCSGLYGGNNNSCSLRIPVDGACGATANECSTGTLTDVQDTTSEHRWRCTGQYGGSDSAVCSAKMAVNGVCGLTRNGCLAGDSENSGSDGTDYTWTCAGRNGGRNDPCTLKIPVNGVCGIANNTCMDGTLNENVYSANSSHHRWRCDGEFGGENSGVCSFNNPVNAVCNPSSRNRCTVGTPSEAANTTSHYTWTCEGLYGGMQEACMINRSPSVQSTGVCDTLVKNACLGGFAINTGMNATHYNWTCAGESNGNNSGICSLNIPVNGACGTDARNSCDMGLASAIPSSNTNYRWTCSGKYGGDSSPVCTYPFQIDGVCGATKDTCAEGDPVQDVDDTTSEHRWRCTGQYNGRTSDVCSVPKPINGACGTNNVRNSCASGNPEVKEPISSHYKWTCKGLYGGTDATTCDSTRVTGTTSNGVCDVSIRNGCIAGYHTDASANATHYEWSCQGENSGLKASCSMAKAVSGSCGVVRNTCARGAPNDKAHDDTPTEYRWRCDGAEGGSNSEVCSLNRPVEGVCSSERNRCTAGTPSVDSSSGSYTPTHYRWTCSGLYGGNNAECNSTRGSSAVNGSCDAIVTNGCLGGTVSQTTMNQTHYNWRCDGANGGSQASCSRRKPLNGACGSQINSCGLGAPVSSNSSNSTHYSWTCAGQYGGSATECSLRVPVNGTCGAARNECSAGSYLYSPATLNEYRWRCSGEYGGSISDVCSAPKPMNGACDAVRNRCTSGSPYVSVPDAANYRWVCRGSHGGNDASCSISRPPTSTVNGACDVSLRNGCLAGFYTPVKANDTHYKWSCTGENGGSQVSCDLGRPLSGSCGVVRNTCGNYTVPNDGAYDDNATHYVWRCDGRSGGSDSGMCLAGKTIGGSCGVARNTCGNYTVPNDGAYDDNATHYVWRCDGRSGGMNSGVCSANKVLNGSCGAARNTCGNYTVPNDEAYDDNATHYVWRCDGRSGGMNSGVCSANKTLSGSCGVARNTCGNYATPNDEAYDDNSTHHRWRCDGRNGGSNSGECSSVKPPVAGACGAAKHSCLRGARNPGR